MKKVYADDIELQELTEVPKEKIYKALLNTAFDNQHSVAWWRLPHQAESQLLISTKTLEVNKDIEKLPQGFIFAPFDTATEAIFLHNDISFHYSSFQLKINVQNKESQICADKFIDDFRKNIKLDKQGTLYFINKEEKCDTTSQTEFTDAVSSAIKKINDKVFQKVVLSKIKKVILDKAFDVVHYFLKLCDKYPNAFVSFVSVPGVGTWLGASPEPLIAVDKNKYFHTVALAGTQPINADTNLKKVPWTEKEIEEQALVSRYIINCFKNIRLREYIEEGPRTLRAGNLAHLRSDFRVDMAATNFPHLGGVMLQLLHPTSAVCGMPKDTAKAFILEKERHKRDFYSGYLGPVNVQEETRLFVNLRCMQLFDQFALLYAGAGITADSDANAEWLETESKCKTMLTVLQ